jgi:hypothetical protein
MVTHLSKFTDNFCDFMHILLSFYVFCRRKSFFATYIYVESGRINLVWTEEQLDVFEHKVADLGELEVSLLQNKTT